MSSLVNPNDPKNNQFLEKGLYVNDDDQDWAIETWDAGIETQDHAFTEEDN